MALKMFLSAIQVLPRLLLDALMPPQCLACNKAVGAPGSLCPTCFSQLNFVASPVCEVCGVPLEPLAGDGLLCGACVRELPVFNRARAVFLYEDASRPLVLKLKHGDRTDTAVHLARWMKRSGLDLIEDCDVIVPVPLHRWRLLVRTYNQSTLLANALGKLSGTSVNATVLTRTRATRNQGGLNRKARRRNVARAFTVRQASEVKGKKILLVDDVLTTGATANACAKALLDAGAVRVDVLVLARVPSPGAAMS